MALTETSTMRVPTGLRDEIARLAERRGTTMLAVVTDAVQRLSRDDWWESVHGALDAISVADATDYQIEAAELDRMAADLRVG